MTMSSKPRVANTAKSCLNCSFNWFPTEMWINPLAHWKWKSRTPIHMQENQEMDSINQFALQFILSFMENLWWSVKWIWETHYVGVPVLLQWKKSFPVTKPNPTKLLSFQLVNAMVGLQLATFPNGDKLTFFIDHW